MHGACEGLLLNPAVSSLTNYVHAQGEELEPARKKAEAAGVKDIFIDDLREEFVSDYVFPMFRRATTLPLSPPCVAAADFT